MDMPNTGNPVIDVPRQLTNIGWQAFGHINLKSNKNDNKKLDTKSVKDENK